MFILDLDKIEKGDIFLTTQNHKISKTIRLATSSDYSHAILYVGGGSYIHSAGTGVHSDNIQRLLFETEDQMTALRLIPDIDREVIEGACNSARMEIGKQYSVKDAIGSLKFPTKKEISNRQFCSRLIARSFESAGLKLVKDSSFCTPQELADSTYTMRVDHCLREATDAEVGFANSFNPNENQREITNKIFTKVRKLTKQDIQTFQQLIDFLSKNPKYDSEITKIIEKSGYLNLWQYDQKKNPWYYDADLFLKTVPVDQQEKVAHDLLEGSEEMKNRFLQNYKSFMSIWQEYNFKYAAVHILLYKNMLGICEQKIGVAQKILQTLKKR